MISADRDAMSLHEDLSAARGKPARPSKPPRLERLVVSPLLYDLPELREANTALLRAVVQRFAPGSPAKPLVARKGPLWGRLLFGQVCGYRYAKRLTSTVRPLAAPLYRAPGVDGAFVRAAVLVRDGDPSGGLSDLRARRIAVDPSDLSSINLLKAEAAPLAGDARFFSHVLQREGPGAPLSALASGEADAALVDAVLLAHLGRLRPQLLSGLRVLLWTARCPAPPFITAGAMASETSHQLGLALADIAQDPELKRVLDQLLIRGFEPIEGAAYRAALHFEQIAQTLGYPELR